MLGCEGLGSEGREVKVEEVKDERLKVEGVKDEGLKVKGVKDEEEEEEK